MAEIGELPDDVAALKALLLAERTRNDRLERLVEAFRQALFGRKSEKLDPDQFELALEDVETGIAAVEAEQEQCAAPPSAPCRRPRAANRAALPKHLPRIEQVIEPEETSCPCGGAMHVIGEDVSERLDVIPAQFRVIVTRRPRYGCRTCEGGVRQAPAPARLIPGGLPTEATVAHVLIAKYADHTPLYRQAQIYSRQGLALDRSTLAHWVGRAAFELRPVFARLLAHLKRSAKLFEALRYIAKLWHGLTLFLEDGRVEIDSNAVERTIRPIALNRKNALFAGHDEGAENWGIIASLVETAKLNGIEPHAYLTRTLEALVNGHRQSRIEELLPWNHATTRAV